MIVRIVSGAIAVISTLAGEILIRTKKVYDYKRCELIEKVQTIQSASISVFAASLIFM